MKVPFKARIRTGPAPIGTLLTLPSPEVAEALSLAGFDWLFFDMEHGPIDILTAQGMVRATGGDCLSMVRVPENSATWIRKVLDIGCDGIVVPLVCSAADARRAIDAATYPPRGQRSVGIARAHGYGLRFAEYVAEANDRITVVVQVEHIAAVERLDEILDVEGVDGVLIGPYDLSGSMNRLGDVRHPEVQSAIATVREKCRRREMPVGMFLLNPEAVATELASGLDFLLVGTDLSFMTGAAKRALTLARSPEAFGQG